MSNTLKFATLDGGYSTQLRIDTSSGHSGPVGAGYRMYPSRNPASSPSQGTAFPISAFLDELSLATTRSDLVVLMNRFASSAGYRNFFISLSGPYFRNAVISNWPSYLVEYFLDTLTVDQIAVNEWIPDEKETSRFDYNLVPEAGMGGDCERLHTIIRSSGLQTGCGYRTRSAGDNPVELVALFNAPESPENPLITLGDFQKIGPRFSEKLLAICTAQGDLKYRISKRELECIKWTAEGKTSFEISVILNLSENTVNNYIATAAKKVGAVNRSHMISIAARSGIIR